MCHLVKGGRSDWKIYFKFYIIYYINFMSTFYSYEIKKT